MLVRGYNNKTLDEATFKAMSEPAKALYNQLMKSAQDGSTDGKFNVGYAAITESPDGYNFNQETIEAIFSRSIMIFS